MHRMHRGGNWRRRVIVQAQEISRSPVEQRRMDSWGQSAMDHRYSLLSVQWGPFAIAFSPYADACSGHRHPDSPDAMLLIRLEDVVASVGM